MEDAAGAKEVMQNNDEKIVKEEIFTKIVRAGKRTYFFDVKATRKEDYYLTITESKKRLGKEGKIFYEKHKIFLYKEDFEKFTQGLRDAVEYIGNGNEPVVNSLVTPDEKAPEELESHAFATGDFTDVDFDDLGKDKA
jgi:hypothetical protein